MARFRDAWLNQLLLQKLEWFFTEDPVDAFHQRRPSEWLLDNGYTRGRRITPDFGIGTTRNENCEYRVLPFAQLGDDIQTSHRWHMIIDDQASKDG